MFQLGIGLPFRNFHLCVTKISGRALSVLKAFALSTTLMDHRSLGLPIRVMSFPSGAQSDMLGKSDCPLLPVLCHVLALV